MAKDKPREKAGPRPGRPQPQAGDPQVFGPLGRPMTKDELVEGRESSEAGTRRPRTSNKH